MSRDYPSDLRYTKEHEWARIEGKVATIGITQFAVESLGDITLVDFQVHEGEKVRREQVLGTVESVKAVSDIYSPVSGTVLKLNDPLQDEPGTLNEDCYDEGWIAQIELSDPGEVADLLSAEQYEEYLNEQQA
ncbi:MAG: glycine cleavage system protein GcvH [Myxococcales bacterium]|nr:glycine cleavage system protein GcvH [Myxococcota bacterium]MDW8280750.1 glycine cleavage system protein GcvH [Myxococcales bacterium]